MELIDILWFHTIWTKILMNVKEAGKLCEFEIICYICKQNFTLIIIYINI